MILDPDFLVTLAEFSIPVPYHSINSGGFIRWGNHYRYYARSIGSVGYCYGDWVCGVHRKWFRIDARTMLESERQEVRQQIKQAQQQIELDRHRRHEEAGNKADIIVDKAQIISAMSDHPYLATKKVLPYGIYLNESNFLVLPMRDIHNVIWNVQYIRADGQKRFLAGGRKKGCFLSIGHLSASTKAYVCEGYATGASIHAATGAPVIVAFDAGNIDPVLADVSKKYPALMLIIAADNDAYGEFNRGLDAARRAASKYKCSYVLPCFEEENRDD